MKLLTTLFLTMTLSIFAQEIPNQQSYTRKKVLEKYLLTPIPVHFYRYFTSNLEEYDKFLKAESSERKLTLDKQYNKSCSEVCPKNLDILSLNNSNYEQTEKNSLGLLNENKHFDNIMVPKYGFCWGHAAMTNLLRHLAFFDPRNEKLVNLKFQKNSPAWRKYVKQALFDIYNKKPRILPYLESIKELSDLFEDDMKKLVIEKWSQEAVGIKNYFKRFVNKKTYSREELKEMMAELESRIKSGQTPEILFNIWNSDIWIHVTMVKKVSYNEYDYTYTLTLDDNKMFNNIASLFEPSTLLVDLKDNSITYPKAELFSAPDERVGKLEILQSNYQMYNSILPRLVNFCKAQTECQE